MKKFLDGNGVVYLWSKITALLDKKVEKEDGKGLSEANFTSVEKAKLSNIADNANNTTIVNTLNSDSTTDALSAAQGKALNDRISTITGDLENLGAGDMMKANYDSDSDGKVDNAENADKASDADKLGGQAPDYYAKASDIPDVSEYVKESTINAMLGKANGVATLDKDGLIPSDQLPSYVDDIVDGYFNNDDNLFYEDSTFSTEIVGEASKIYVDVSTHLSYRYSGSVFVLITSVDMLPLDNTEIDEILVTITS